MMLLMSPWNPTLDMYSFLFVFLLAHCVTAYRCIQMRKLGSGLFSTRSGKLVNCIYP